MSTKNQLGKIQALQVRFWGCGINKRLARQRQLLRSIYLKTFALLWLWQDPNGSPKPTSWMALLNCDRSHIVFSSPHYFNNNNNNDYF